MTMQGISEAMSSSGGVLYLMALLLLLAFTVIIERAWFLSRILGRGNRLLQSVTEVEKLEVAAFQRLVEGSTALPHAAVLQAALQHDLRHDFERIADKLEESIMREAPAVDRYLWVLDTIVTLAPLLGLLGTIIGMFNAFHVLGDPNNAPTQVTGGVAEALLATACGLFIAIIGLVALNALNNRVRIVMHQLETLKMMLVNRLYPHYHEAADERRGAVSERRMRVGT